MTRYTRIALAVFAGLALTAGVGVITAQGTSKALAHCGSGGPGTMFDDPEVRVFERELPDGGKREVACSHYSGHRTRLAQDDGDSPFQTVDQISAPGRWLGYARLTYSSSGSGAEACVARLRDGKRRCTPVSSVARLGATNTGSVAWVGGDGYDSDGDPVCCAVFKRDAGAAEATKLDSGPDIDADTFAVGGHRIYWVNGGEVKSATMP